MLNVLDLTEDLQKQIQKCCGVGYRLDGKGRVVECSCLTNALFELRLSKSGIPPRFRNLTFKDYMYQNSDTFKKVWKYIEQADKALQQGIGLFLYGPQHTGKSMLACCIIKELIKRGNDCGFVIFSGVIGNPADQERYLGQSMKFSCVDNITQVLDNLANFRETTLTGQQTNGAVGLLENIVSTRVTWSLSTIMTSTVSINDIEKRFPSLGAMLLGSFLQVECVTNDFRGTRAQERLATEFGFDEIP